MEVRNPLSGELLAQGCLGKALLPRQRQLPHINNGLHACVPKAANERLDIEPLVSERVQVRRLHRWASRVVQMEVECSHFAALHNEA